MNRTNKVNYILTDLDGVIRIWNNKRVSKYESENNLAYGSIHEIFFNSVLLNKAITGIISDKEWKNEIALLVKDKYPKLDVKEMVRVITYEECTINHNIFGLYKKYFPNSFLVLTTNATSRLNEDLEKHNILSFFDFIYNSSVLGIAKPQKEYYLSIKKGLHFTYDEVIYIDDSLKNVEVARSLGIKSHYFNELDSLEVFLKENS